MRPGLRIMAAGPVGGYRGVNGSRALSDIFAYEPGTTVQGRQRRFGQLAAEQHQHKVRRCEIAAGVAASQFPRRCAAQGSLRWPHDD